MVWCLHLYFGLKAAFEFKGKVVFKDSDPLDQPPDQPFVVTRHRLLMLVQKGFELIQPLLESCAVGLFDQQVLLLFPERIDLVSQFLEALLVLAFFRSSFCRASSRSSISFTLGLLLLCMALSTANFIPGRNSSFCAISWLKAVTTAACISFS